MSITPHPLLFPDKNPQLPFPPDFATSRMCYESLTRDCSEHSHLSMVGTRETPGLRFTFRPFCWEEFNTKNEPPLPTDGPKRIAFWQPLYLETKSENPWKRPPFFMPKSIVKQWGYVCLQNLETYCESWSEHAQRHRKKFLAQNEWHIEEIGPDAFLAAYRRSPKDYLLTTLFSGHLKNKMKAHGPLVHLFAAKKKETGNIGAGLAVLDIPEIKSSLNIISFIHPCAQKHSVGVGLIDHWFKHGLANGFQFLDFGCFWAPGSPKEWIGFSNFKAQFGTRLYTRPTSVYTWVGSMKETLGL